MSRLTLSLGHTSPRSVAPVQGAPAHSCPTPSKATVPSTHHLPARPSSGPTGSSQAEGSQRTEPTRLCLSLPSWSPLLCTCQPSGSWSDFLPPILPLMLPPPSIPPSLPSLLPLPLLLPLQVNTAPLQALPCSRRAAHCHLLLWRSLFITNTG